MKHTSRLLLILMVAVITTACSTPGAKKFTESRWNCALLGGVGAGAAGAFDDGETAVTMALVGATLGAVFCGDDDTDGDGVKDGRDQCPGTPAGAPVDENGCEFDSDGDGVVDSEDRCPNTPLGTPVDSTGCPLDDDGDGVPNNKDQCPGTPKGAKVNAVGCADTDKDGVYDYRDKCPNTEPGQPVDNDGCDLAQEYRLENVNFEFASANLTAAAKKTLDEDVKILLRNDNLKVEVAGHTDSVGTAEYNMGLSQRRAESVRNYLISKGAKAANMTAKGYGETDPIATNDTDAGRALNRRVEFRQQ